MPPLAVVDPPEPSLVPPLAVPPVSSSGKTIPPSLLEEHATITPVMAAPSQSTRETRLEARIISDSLSRKVASVRSRNQ
jgi:hypothetical protein